jgi:hypothetical protein
VNIDRVVVTTFPGYFFTQVLSLRSIQQYAAGFPIDIVIDDFGLRHWPSYVQDCQQFLNHCFPDNNFTYYLYSQLPGIEKVQTGGWFRQQLIKMYLDQLVPGDRWLLVDADVTFLETPNIDAVSAVIRGSNPIDCGNRMYVQHMLGTEQPWVNNETEFWCLSSVPFRLIERELIVNLRQHTTQLHNRDFLQHHLDLFETQQLVAFDPAGQTMVMSEFQLIEVFRHRYYHNPLPIRRFGSSKFDHSSNKDWKFQRSWFEQHNIDVPDHYWNSSQTFGNHHV